MLAFRSPSTFAPLEFLRSKSQLCSAPLLDAFALRCQRTPTMSDKSSSDNNVAAAHDEKNEKHAGLNDGLAEAGGRRGSVALNVVENPLRVGLQQRCGSQVAMH